MIVMKFGGTSVGSADSIRALCGIVAGRRGRQPVVVVSAMSGVTDALLRLAATAAARRAADIPAQIAALREKHLEAAARLLPGGAAGKAELGLMEVQSRTLEILEELERMAGSVAVLGELTPRSQDAMVSCGERLSSVLVAAALCAGGLSAVLWDARELVATDARFTCAAPDVRETARRARATLRADLDAGRVPVTQGFIGSTTDGITTTLGRGGSDFSAALLGAALDAEAIEIWTDVDGMLTADPRVVPGALRVRALSFDEASELSYFGARVLHPSTVLPAIEKKIPVHIYNTHNPSCEGTRIQAEPVRSRNLIKSVASKRGVTVVNVASTRMLQAYGFLSRIFETFARHETPVDVVTTSEVSVSMTIEQAARLGAIREELRAIGEVTVESGRAIVCVVGENLKRTPGAAARVLAAAGPAVIHMISQGASEINLTFVIEESELGPVVRRIHEEFFRDADADVFAPTETPAEPAPPRAR